MWCCSVHRRIHLQCLSFSGRPLDLMELVHWCLPGSDLLRCCKPGSSCNGTPVFCLRVHTSRPIVHPTFSLVIRKYSRIISQKHKFSSMFFGGGSQYDVQTYIYSILYVGTFKYTMYKRNPHTPEELRNTILREISTVSGDEVQRVNSNIFSQLYRVHSVRRGIYSASAVLLVSFIRLFKGNYRCEFLSRSLRLLPLPTRNARCSAGWPTVHPPLLGQVGNGLPFFFFFCVSTDN